jgi:hypothetical protein
VEALDDAAPFLLPEVATCSDGDSDRHGSFKSQDRRAKRAGQRFAPPLGKSILRARSWDPPTPTPLTAEGG